MLCFGGEKNILNIEEEEESLFKAKARKEMDAGARPIRGGGGFISIQRRYRGTQGACGSARARHSCLTRVRATLLTPLVGQSDFARFGRLTTLLPRFEYVDTGAEMYSFRVCTILKKIKFESKFLTFAYSSPR